MDWMHDCVIEDELRKIAEFLNKRKEALYLIRLNFFITIMNSERQRKNKTAYLSDIKSAILGHKQQKPNQL